MNLLKSKSPAQTPVRGRKLLTALSLVAIAACLLVLLPTTRAALIDFGGTLAASAGGNAIRAETKNFLTNNAYSAYN